MRSSGEMRHEILCLTVRKGAIIQAWPVPELAASESEGAESMEPAASTDADASGEEQSSP